MDKEPKILSSSMIVSGISFGILFRLLMNIIINNEKNENYNFHTALAVNIGIGFGAHIVIKILEKINRKNLSESLNEKTPLLSKNKENNFDSSHINSIDLQNQPSTSTGIYYL